jgi:polyhydroxyalkanoate synthesis regulator phasin
MSEFIKKLLLMSVGIIFLTKERIKAFVQALVKKGELTRQEGEKLVKELLQKVEESKSFIDTKVKAAIKKYIKELHLVTREELEKALEEFRKRQK